MFKSELLLYPTRRCK